MWLTDRKNLEAEIHALREPRLTQPLSGPVPSASETSEVFVVVRCGFPRKMWGLAWGLMLDRHVGKCSKVPCIADVQKCMENNCDVFQISTINAMCLFGVPPLQKKGVLNLPTFHLASNKS